MVVVAAAESSNSRTRGAEWDGDIVAWLVGEWRMVGLLLLEVGSERRNFLRLVN